MSSHQHPYGNPENILGFTEDDKVFIHDEPLKKMFLHPDVKHRKIVAFSIIGAYRKGKSFFLDYCLRYLYAHYPSINFPNNPVPNPENWIGDKNEPLNGFSWRPGSIRVTTGLDIWNDVFLYTNEASGQEAAIIVMDTHGLFDKETSSVENSRIFTLGTLISSVQVINISGIIQDDQLQYLHSATECAKFVTAVDLKKDEKCFQNLMFLIRDWNNPDEFHYGIEGGNRYLNHFSEVASRNKKELKYVFESIYDSFEIINCSLLAHPGKTVSRGKKGNQEYDGNWKEMDEDFKDELIILINFLLNANQLAVKKVNGNPLNGEEFLDFSLNQLKLFQTDEVLKAQTMCDLMTEKEMETLVSSCIDFYKGMGNQNKDAIKTEADIPKLHELCKKEALIKYDNSKKMGNLEDYNKFRKILNEKIEQLFEEFMTQLKNDRKRLEDEKEKLCLELEERQRKALENIEQEKRMAEKRLEMERLKAREALENENKLKEQEIEEINKQTEQERLDVEKRKEEGRLMTKITIDGIHERVAESKQQLEDFKVKEQEDLKDDEKQVRGLLEKTPLEFLNSTLQNMSEASGSSTVCSNHEAIKDAKILPTTEELATSSPTVLAILNINETTTETIKKHNQNSDHDQKVISNFQLNKLGESTNIDNKSTQTDALPSIENNTKEHKIDQQKNKIIEDNFEKQGTSSIKVPNIRTENSKIQQHSLMETGEGSASNVKFHDSCKVVKMISFSKSNKPYINEKLLSDTFEHPDVKYRSIIIFSIAGANGKDKNLFSEHCLRFLYEHYKSLQNSFQSGIRSKFYEFSSFFESTGDEPGIYMWNDVFLYTDNFTGENLALILMDTQGIFDYRSSSIEDSKTFALGTLISSIQVLNLTEDIHINQIRFLNFATEFATSSSRKSFAHLVFLIRNWNNHKKYGLDDGDKYVQSLLSTGIWKSLISIIKGGKEKELKSLRDKVYKSFEEFNCVLLPGVNTFNSSKHGPSNSEIVKMKIESLIKNYLSPERLVPKTIAGKVVTGQELYKYILSCYHHIQSDGTSFTQNVFESGIKKEIDQIIDISLNCYDEEMSKNSDVIKSTENIKILHKYSKDKALKCFDESYDAIGYSDDTFFRNELKGKIEVRYRNIQSSIQN